MTPPTRPLSALVASALVAASLATVAATAGAATPTCFGKPATIVGTSDGDVIDLTGNPGQIVVTGPGDDSVVGSDGKDIVCLGSGDDHFIGNGGNDKVSAGAGNDTIDGGPGNDTIKGKAGDDEIEGGTGDDDLRGGPGRDHVSGGEGDDVVKGGSGNDRINGGDATTSVATSGDDLVKGGKGYDRLWSNWGYDDADTTGTLNGGPGYDYCSASGIRKKCERDHHYAPATEDPTENEWYPLVDEIFTAWGLDQEQCATHQDASQQDVELCIGDQRANGIEVLMCESSGWPFAQNGTSGTAGLFQNHPLYWNERARHLVATYGSDSQNPEEYWFAADFPGDPYLDAHEYEDPDPNIYHLWTTPADPFDPRWNVEMAAMLVYEARQTILLQKPAPDYDFPMVGGLNYPDFNYDAYTTEYYRDDGVSAKTAAGIWHMLTGGYPNGGEGPEPWGQWVSCGAPDTVWGSGNNLYDPAWVSPWSTSEVPSDWPLPDVPE